MKCNFWNCPGIDHLFNLGAFPLSFPRPALISMATVSNTNLLRQTQMKQDESVEVDKQLARMDDDIRRLKIEFDIYFNGASKRPPLEARARLDAFIKRVSDNRNLTYAQRYQLNTLVARFVSYRELWRRNLRAKGEELV